MDLRLARVSLKFLIDVREKFWVREKWSSHKCDRTKSYVKGNIDRTPPTFSRHETSLQTGRKHSNHRPQPRNPQEHDEMVSFLPFRTLNMVPRKSGVSFQRDESVGRDGCGRMSLDGVLGWWWKLDVGNGLGDGYMDRLEGRIALGPWRCCFLFQWILTSLFFFS